MFAIIVDGRVVETVLGWDVNDATVYATRKYGVGATARRATK